MKTGIFTDGEDITPAALLNEVTLFIGKGSGIGPEFPEQLFGIFSVPGTDKTVINSPEDSRI
ncbi:MAG: hypothetical protein MUE37_07055 [Bacteroidales bacterium]|nr:hypothetical protein [Bacteroidales bacterium]